MAESVLERAVGCKLLGVSCEMLLGKAASVASKVLVVGGWIFARSYMVCFWKMLVSFNVGCLIAASMGLLATGCHLVELSNRVRCFFSDGTLFGGNRLVKKEEEETQLALWVFFLLFAGGCGRGGGGGILPSS